MTPSATQWGWLVVGMGSVLGACGGRGQAGLVNVPALDNRLGPEDRGHDVIANGQEGCGGPGPKNKSDQGKRPPVKCEEVASPAKPPGPPPASRR